ncbi:hypothetical protein AB0B88_15975 [Micromonospora haikouensis]|uniref:hypothetical protein n=1 Tax=Micromonospora haikouensis TaxID=686309 RepID=UPI00340E6178
MTSMYDETSPAMDAVIAAAIVDAHDQQPCAGCTPAGCEALTAAATTVTQYRAARDAVRRAAQGGGGIPR